MKYLKIYSFQKGGTALYWTTVYLTEVPKSNSLYLTGKEVKSEICEAVLHDRLTKWRKTFQQRT
ncbi:MAG: hypothetical protein D3906_17460 [Candidatus Electrothrix sp. AUS1_2]|nr:hypothetical protein [Candidatus Electrothrix sp. AUS1_2]